jgi:hypothetical protein
MLVRKLLMVSDAKHDLSLTSFVPSLVPPNSVTPQWNKDQLLPDARKEMCSGGGTTRKLLPNGSYVHARKPAKVGIMETCSASSMSPITKWSVIIAVVALTALQLTGI